MLHNAIFLCKDVQHTISAYIKCQDIQHTISAHVKAHVNVCYTTKRELVGMTVSNVTLSLPGVFANVLPWSADAHVWS